MDVPGDEVGVEKSKKKSYRHEYKLKVIQWYQDNGRNKGLTSRHFQVDGKRIREWVDNEEKTKARLKKKHQEENHFSHVLKIYFSISEFLLLNGVEMRGIKSKRTRS